MCTWISKIHFQVDFVLNNHHFKSLFDVLRSQKGKPWLRHIPGIDAEVKIMATNTHLLSSSFTLISQSKFPLVGCIRSVHFCMGPLWWWLCCKQIFAFLISCLIVAEVILYLVLKFYWLFFDLSGSLLLSLWCLLLQTSQFCMSFGFDLQLNNYWTYFDVPLNIYQQSCNCRLELPWINIMPCFCFNYWSLIFC